MARPFRRKPPVLFTEHGRWFPDFPRRKRIAFNRMMLKRRDRVTAVGESVRTALVRNEGIPARRIDLIYNGVCIARRRSWSAAEDGKIIAIGRAPGDGGRRSGFCHYSSRSAGRAERPSHGTSHVETARRTRAQIRLVLVGEGPTRPAIETEIEQLQLRPYIRLLGLRHDVPHLLAAADLFLLTSISEGIPLTVIEAMAAGLPVVSTNVGGLPEVVVERETGLMAPSGDAAALAAAVSRLARDASLRKQNG